jgi:hypothetical protein
VTGDIRFDDRHWPLVIVTFRGAAPRPVFDAYLQRMEDYLARAERHCYLLDAREGAMLGHPERSAQGEWLKRHSAELERWSVGTGLVVRSAAVRFVLSAIYLIQAPLTPTETFNTVDDAHRWLQGLMMKEGRRIPPRRALEI